MEMGNPGDARSVGHGILEMRIDYGPGYRIYYVHRGAQIVILLHGGDKRTRVFVLRTMQNIAGLPLLDQLITIVTAATLMAYSLYTFQSPTGNHRLMITIPFVLYGMFRYLYLVHMRMEGGSPEEVLLRDRHMLGTVVLCTALIIVVLYLLPQ